MSLDVRLGKRKTVNMNEDIAAELNRMANSQGKTLYGLINEIGLSALEANKSSFTLDEAIKTKKLIERARKSRMVLVNQDLWYFASSEALKSSKTKWLKHIYGWAQWQANVFLNNASDEELVASIRALIADFFWDCGDITIEQVDGAGGLSLRLAFVPEMPLEHTQGLFKFFEGIFNSQGFLPTSSDVEPGFLTVTFKKLPLEPSKR